MKVLDLQCGEHHVFEGWFASEDDFQSQLGRGLVACPLCGDVQIEKKLSAPRLNLGAAAPVLPSPGQKSDLGSSAANGSSLAVAGPSADTAQALQATWMQMMRRVVANTEDVGDKFAEVARQMHYGERDERAIRGQTSAREAVALLEEGITVVPLTLPDALKEPLQLALNSGALPLLQG